MKASSVLFSCILLAGIARGAGFADFDRRAKAGEVLNVVFFGGSLTYGANASDPNVTGVRGLMADYFRERYPLARFRFHDAAIGGAGSLLGAFRLERDVLSHRPDLVFLDFLCNDGTDEPNLDATCAYEYILRELIGRGIPVEQMFFTFRFWAGKGFDPVKSLPRRNFYRRLAEAYGTPSGDVQLEALGRDLASGRTTLDEVWPLDGGHPCDFGYRYFFEAVKSGYERGVAEKSVCRVPETPVYGTMKDVRRTRIVEGGLPEGWTRQLTFRTSMWYDGLSSRWMGDVAGATPKAAPLSFDATCNYIGFFGEGDEDGLSFELSDANGTLETFRSSPGPGRLFFFRSCLLPEWEKGAKARRFVVKPVAAEKGELRIESVLTATIVPTDPTAVTANETTAKDGIEALDHARGRKDGGNDIREDLAASLVFTDGRFPVPDGSAFARYELTCLKESGETLVVTGEVATAGIRPLAEGLHALKPLAGKGETVRFLAFDPPSAFDAAAFAKSLPHAAAKIGAGEETVLFFAGDSVTATGDYGRMLALMLRRATGNARIRAAKHAYAGCSADASVRNFARDTRTDSPDAVFVMYGLNDAACSIPCDVFTGELSWLAREAKARFSADAVYLTPTPHFADDVNPRRTVGFGELVRRTGEEDGVTVVDAFYAIWSARANWKRLYPPAFFRPFEATGAEPGDTIHPNALGHLRIARRAYETLMGRAKGPAPLADAAELPVDPPCRAQMTARTAPPTWRADGRDVLRLGLPEHATSSSGCVEDNRASPDEGTSDWCVSVKGRDLVFTVTTDAANRKDTFNLFFDPRPVEELGTMGPYYWIECRFRDDGSVELRPGESSPAGAQATGLWLTANGRIRAEIAVPARVFGAEAPVLPLGFSLVWRHTGRNGMGTRLSWSERCHEWNPTGYGRIVSD